MLFSSHEVVEPGRYQRASDRQGLPCQDRKKECAFQVQRQMGPSADAMAVVDQYGRVHGIEALRVLELSICPNVVRANTNATAIMITERAAGWIP